MEIISIVVVALSLCFIVWAIKLFNRLIKLKTLNEEGWSGVLVVLKRRRALIPNIIDIADLHLNHETGAFCRLTQAQELEQAANSVAEMARAEASMTAALAGFKAIVENYPYLQSDENMMHIQQELRELEERIEKVRRYYNATARDYNMEMAQFPANLVVGLMGFKSAEFFETDE